jgi:hypothetical protein
LINRAVTAVERLAFFGQLRFDHPAWQRGMQKRRTIFALFFRAWPQIPTGYERQKPANAFEIEAFFLDQAANAANPMHIRLVKQTLSRCGFMRLQKAFAFVHANRLHREIKLSRYFPDLEPCF